MLIRLKQALVTEGLVSREEMLSAERMAKRDRCSLRESLVKSEWLTEEQLGKFIGKTFQIPYVNLKNYTVDRKILDRLSDKIARRYQLIPLFEIEGVVTVAVADPLDLISLDELSKVAQTKIETVIASRESIDVAIDQWYGMGKARKDFINELASELKESEQELEQDKPLNKELYKIRLTNEASGAPIVQLVNGYIAQAMLEGASDVHLRPGREGMTVRFRIDGFLYKRHVLETRLIPPITSRIKILSGLDITKRNIPQDGRMGVTLRDRNLDIRTSTFPSMFGENIVLRILDKSKGAPTLSELGLSLEGLRCFQNLIKASKGIILATGPTGSGKTTTLYSAIESLTSDEKNIMTIEDPIEYELDSVVQAQVNIKVGLTFAMALRSILRQDPDIIYVGEIRDAETAEVAVRAALTGHLVFSTLHSNDAVGSITRLIDIGVAPILIESALNCSFAQRLVRNICPRCTEKYQPSEALLKRMKLPLKSQFYKGKGCDYCTGTGYRGRVAIFEILVMSPEIKSLIAKKGTEGEILKVASLQGMTTLFEDGIQKVLQGITTIEEVERVTQE